MIIRHKVLVAYILLTIAAVTALLYPNFWAIPSILSLGLLSLVPAVWLYSTILLPVLLLRSSSSWAGFAKAASIGIAACVAVGVPFFLNAAIDRAADRATEGDFINRPAALVRHVTFVENSVSGNVRENDPLTITKCDKLCQRLLLNKSIETVTVVFEKGGTATTLVQYRLESRTRCPEAFAAPGTAIIDTVRHAIEGECIIADVGRGMNNGLVLKQIPLYPTDLLDLGSRSPEASRLLIWEKSGETLTPIVQRTSVEYFRSADLLIPVHYFGLLTTVAGWQVAGERAFINGASLAEFLEAELHISALPPMSDGGERQFDRPALNLIRLDSMTVSRLLDDTDNAPFNRDVTEAITGWVAGLAYRKSGPPSEEETILVRRIISDHRISNLQSVGWTLFRQSQLAKDTSSDVVHRLCKPNNNLDVVSAQQLIRALKQHRLLTGIDKITDKEDAELQFVSAYCA